MRSNNSGDGVDIVGEATAGQQWTGAPPVPDGCRPPGPSRTNVAASAEADRATEVPP